MFNMAYAEETFAAWIMVGVCSKISLEGGCTEKPLVEFGWVQSSTEGQDNCYAVWDQ